MGPIAVLASNMYHKMHGTNFCKAWSLCLLLGDLMPTKIKTNYVALSIQTLKCRKLGRGFLPQIPNHDNIPLVIKKWVSPILVF